MYKNGAYKDLEGKKLLFLGAVQPLCEPVEIAKKMGIHTIVIDYLPDSPAKKVADEAYLISTTDVDAVVDFCKKNHVDGLFTAFIDSMLPYAREICDRLGFPFYASKEQIQLSLDKRFFKKTCMEYGVPVPRDWTKEIEEKGIDKIDIRFPVIVKPVDYSGGKGVRICNSKDEFQAAYDYAMRLSPGKNVLVEEYLKGDEITATYTMKDGEISFSVLRDKLLSTDHENITSQGDVLVTPSRYLQRYIDELDPAVKKMLKGIKATDGTVFFQGVANQEKISFFECGYRPNGAHDYRHIEKMNGINYMEMMIAHALTGKMEGYELSQDNPFFSKYTVSFNLWAHGGTIGSLDGVDEVRKIDNVIVAEYKREVGDVLQDNNTLTQMVFRAVIMDDSIENVKGTIAKIQSIIKVRNTEGKDMCYVPFNRNRLDVYREVIK